MIVNNLGEGSVIGTNYNSKPSQPLSDGMIVCYYQSITDLSDRSVCAQNFQDREQVVSKTFISSTFISIHEFLLTFGRISNKFTDQK